MKRPHARDLCPLCGFRLDVPSSVQGLPPPEEECGKCGAPIVSACSLGESHQVFGCARGHSSQAIEKIDQPCPMCPRQMYLSSAYPDRGMLPHVLLKT
jgi:hypothetical protein